MQDYSFFQRISEYQPTPWEMIPDLGLYMDQVVTFIERQLETLYGEKARGMLTPSMINNYVKTGLAPRPLGKKYYREHLAVLMMIVMLKPVASMDDISKLTALAGGRTVEQLYSEFCRTQAEVFSHVSIDPAATALQHAVTATAYSMIAEAALNEDLWPEEGQGE